MELQKKKWDRNEKEWGDFSDTYQSILENTAIQSSMILYSITRAKDYSKLCEVGVGCGLASRMFVSNIMKNSTVYCASDIADGMNQKYKEGFTSADVSLNPKVKYQWVGEEESLDISKLASGLGVKFNKMVLHLKADNESLPYSDGTFDCYLSSLSLNLVNDHKKMLAESFRVLENGGVAGFTVLGRIENCNYATFLPEVAKSLGHDHTHDTDIKHPAHLGDKESLVKDIKDAGFTSVKTYYTKTNIIFES